MANERVRRQQHWNIHADNIQPNYRNCRRADGTAKASFPNKKTARAFINRKQITGATAYKCKVCANIHIGNKRKNPE